MAEDKLHRQKFNVDQWPTSKVTLYPTRASVVRQIEGVKLKPGLNEITISDLTSLADQDSIRIAGTTDDHPARINDLTVDPVPNIYSSLSLDDSDDESEDESEEEEPEALQTARELVRKVDASINDVKERKSASEKEISLLEHYCECTSNSTADKTAPATMKEALGLYASQRKTHYDIIQACALQLSELRKSHAKASKAVEKEEKNYARASRAKKLTREKKKAEREERKRERREQTAAKSTNVYRVRITIEVPASVRPTEVAKTRIEEKAEEAGEASSSAPVEADVVQDATLILSYTTSAASWTPHYDLRLDTTHPTRSTLTYRAHFTNRTYETWSNAQLTLSTSQASFGGLGEKVPRMESWRVNMAKAWVPDVQRRGANGLFSMVEQKIKEEEHKVLYEVANDQMRQNQKQMNYNVVPTQAISTIVAQQSSMDGTGFRSKKSKAGGGLFGGIASASAAPSRGAVLGSGGDYARDEEKLSESGTMEFLEAGGMSDGMDDDGHTLAATGTLIAHAAAGADTYGFTTTYELPTPRTVPSTELVRRHVIAEIPLPSLMFTHVIIPKLKAAAFLKARVTNTSAIPLLAGVAGLTLDGSFLGNLSFPRCSPDETVVLELGVDQSVKVEYERPTVKRASQGMIIMGKEEVGVFKRTMRLTNTKSASVSLVVLDQVPVSEDDKLKVTILAPKGLKSVDDVVRSGVGVDGKALTVKPKPHRKPVEHHAAAPSISVKSEGHSETATTTSSTVGTAPGGPATTLRSSIRRFPSFSAKRESMSIPASMVPAPPPLPTTPTTPAAPVATATGSGASAGSTAWGTAKATLRKNGEVRFDVDLQKGGCVSIGLEWECRMPGGEGVAALS